MQKKIKASKMSRKDKQINGAITQIAGLQVRQTDGPADHGAAEKDLPKGL